MDNYYCLCNNNISRIEINQEIFNKISQFVINIFKEKKLRFSI